MSSNTVLWASKKRVKSGDFIFDGKHAEPHNGGEIGSLAARRHSTTFKANWVPRVKHEHKDGALHTLSYAQCNTVDSNMIGHLISDESQAA